MTHIVGKLDSVLQKVADHRQEVMNTTVVTSPTANGHDQGQNGDPSPQTVTLRKHSSVDGSITENLASVAPLRERIQNMRLSVSSVTDQNNFNSLNRERRRKRSPASSTVESSGEHQEFPTGEKPAKETTSRV